MTGDRGFTWLETYTFNQLTVAGIPASTPASTTAQVYDSEPNLT